MRTTLTLDDDVAASLERLRKAGNRSMKELVNEALRYGLRQLSRPSPRRKRFRTRSVSVGRCLVGSIDNIAEVIAVAEGESYR